MRRHTSALMAAGYALSFLVVCLAACLAPAAGGEHGCCPEGEGWSARAADCCSIVPGVAQAGAPALAAPAAAAFGHAAPVAAVPVRAERHGLPASTPSPPLVL
ncbi:MAG TPA: hypothetical protein VFO85_19335, partial [Vicinamibacteria bacterium]|nr:hypothetical protein [Vicinamibacteria bacterium]